MGPAAEAVMDDRPGRQRQMPVQLADKKDAVMRKRKEIKALTRLTVVASSSLSLCYH